MAGAVKGITIEFRGDTRDLSRALKTVRNETRTTESALKEVNRALKFNPHNVELLTQKQRLLKDRVQETANKVKELKNIQKQLDAKGVDKTSGEYQKLRREILMAENQQKHFTKEMIRFGNAKLNAVGGQITAIGNKLTTVNRRARQVLGAFTALALYKGFERLKTLDEVSTELGKLGYEGDKLDTVMQAATESVSGTKFALTDMAKVMKGALGSGVTDAYDLGEYLGRTADLAQLAGIDVQKMGAMMNKAYSKGKVDAKLLNQLNANGIPIYKLLQDELGVSADELSKMTRAGEVGFDDLYKATEKYQGLAQEMGTETFSGAATVLSQQFGLIGADFLSGAYEPIKEGVKGIVAWLKQLRADGTFKEWGQMVGDVINYFVGYIKDGTTSMNGLSEGARNLVTFLKPFVDVLTMIINISRGLPTPIKQFGVFMALFGSPAMRAVGMFSETIGKIGTGIGVMAEKAGVSTAALQTWGGAIGIIAVNLGMAALGLRDLITGTNDYTRAYQSNAEARAGAVEEVEAQYGAAQMYASELDRLSAKENKSAEDKAKIKQYVDLLNGSVDGLNLTYNEEKDTLSKTTEEIYKSIDAMKEQALAAAYKEQIADASRDLVKAETDLADEQEHLTELQKLYNDAVSTGNSAGIRTLGEEINKSKVKINGYNKVISASKSEIDKYAKGYQNAANSTTTATKKMSSNVKKDVAGITHDFSKSGAQAPKKLADGIKNGRGGVNSAASSVRQGAKKELSSSKMNASSLGSNWTSGLASGIRKGVGWVTSAVSWIAGKIKKQFEKDADEHSPSRVAMELGDYWTQGLALGIKDRIAAVRMASSEVARAANVGGGTVNNNETNKNLNANYTIIVNGGTDPEEYGRQLARGLQQEMRTF